MYGNCKFDIIHLNQCMRSICILIINKQTERILMWLVLLNFLKAKKQLVLTDGA